MSRLDALLKKKLIPVPQTINSSFNSDSVDISFREGAFAIQVVYDSGNGSVDMDLYYELSMDNINFARVEASKQTITDDSGMHIWDIGDTGTNYLRVAIVVRDGSIDAQSINYSAKRRH